VQPQVSSTLKLLCHRGSGSGAEICDVLIWDAVTSKKCVFMNSYVCLDGAPLGSEAMLRQAQWAWKMTVQATADCHSEAPPIASLPH